MNGAGAFLVIAGVWVIAQVLWGNALQRVGIFGGVSKDMVDQLAAQLKADPTNKRLQEEYFQLLWQFLKGQNASLGPFGNTG